MSTIIAGRTLEWQIRAQMKSVGIRTVAELHRRLREIDPDSVNFVQLCKFVRQAPALVSVRTLLGLALVLGCEVGDIVCIREAAQDKNSGDNHVRAK